mgnify:CR=1 FL=1
MLAAPLPAALIGAVCVAPLLCLCTGAMSLALHPVARVGVASRLSESAVACSLIPDSPPEREREGGRGREVHTER